MNNLHYIVVPNPLKGQETAVYDYIGQFITNGTTRLDDLCDKIAAGRPNIDAPLVKLVIKTFFAEMADGIAGENVRYNFDGISFESAISGSVPSVDGALTAENELYVLVTVGNPLRAEMALLKASTGIESTVAVKIDSVEDLATHEVGVIHGTATAIVAGLNLSATRTGESIALTDPLTGAVVSTGTVVAEEGCGQHLKVNFAAPFAAGTYNLRLVTRGYATPDATPETYTKKVTATEASAPVTTIASVKDPEGLAQAKVGMGITIEGAYLPTEASELKVAANKLRTMNGTTEVSAVGFDTLAYDGAFVSNTATQIVLNELIWTPLMYLDATEMEVVINGATKRVPIKAS